MHSRTKILLLLVFTRFAILGDKLLSHDTRTTQSHIDVQRTSENLVDSMHNFPWLVSLRLHNQHICGASVLHTRWILTASICVCMHSRSEIDTDVYDVLLGSGHKSNIHLGLGKIHKVSDIIRHPKFDATSKPHLYNVALVRVIRPIDYDAFTKPVLLGQTHVAEGRWATISGWGETNNNVSCLYLFYMLM